ncbi:hypothetical protein GLOIN_2v1736381 [Rhizophagus clarus]|uniref:Uncharacterized protein n=1 Tax=Rhizophagus clarus TaxID=94130 RepID=A0A8H3M433_9GLOM|nr:hypothetical protein GLOIN_2v1736381 [Rhizophagus clarus]
MEARSVVLNCLFYLRLWKVHVQTNRNDLMEEIPLRDDDELIAMYKIIKYWTRPEDIPEENIHVIVKAPSSTFL